uniref:Uncharacterized protein n=1 Tax=Chenopodium quinoa TaxID=63459 RepID=A0A803MT67_CHEQI
MASSSQNDSEIEVIANNPDELEKDSTRQFIRCLDSSPRSRAASTDQSSDPFLAPTVARTLAAGSCSILITLTAASLRRPSQRKFVMSSRSQVPKLLQPAAAVTTEDRKSKLLVKEFSTAIKKFTLQGKMQNNDSISMTLSINVTDDPKIQNKDFLFSIKTDAVSSIVGGLATEFGLSDEDTEQVAKIMEEIIAEFNDDDKNESFSEDPWFPFVEECSADTRSTHKTSRVEGEEATWPPKVRRRYNEDMNQEQHRQDEEGNSNSNCEEEETKQQSSSEEEQFRMSMSDDDK